MTGCDASHRIAAPCQTGPSIESGRPIPSLQAEDRYEEAGAAAGASRVEPVGAPAGEAEQRQPGATQGAPTTGTEMVPTFDMRYFVGEWEVEWTPLDTPLLPGGAYTGTETIRPIESGHYFDVTVELGGPDGSLRGRGIMFLESGPFGSHLTKYVVYDAGFTLLQPGPVGCDLGGYYSHFWEIPEPIHHNDSSVLIKGRSYYVSPAAYRVNQQISVDDEPFMNFGIMWYTKVMENAEP